jgi:hypothetical protein
VEAAAAVTVALVEQPVKAEQPIAVAAVVVAEQTLPMAATADQELLFFVIQEHKEQRAEM